LVLERLGVPPVVHQPAYVDELVVAWRRVLETLVEYLTISSRRLLASSCRGPARSTPVPDRKAQPVTRRRDPA
jgi:hypothetical protein